MSTLQSTEVDGVEFLLDTRSGPERLKSESNRFVLVKSKDALDFYDSLRDDAPNTILELGMFEGGSLVYFDKIYSPDTLVGVDIRKSPIDALEHYVSTRPHIKTFYGLSQDHLTTRRKVQSCFPKGIDLVIDDASHHYEATKATFENIFPLVSPGGLYVIEDWAWSHRAAHQAETDAWHERPALTNLIFNLVVMASIARVIETVTVKHSLVCIRKGRGMLPDTGLDVSQYLRGKRLELI